MPRLRVHNFTLSLDGYGAGPDQSVEEPLGAGGEQLHDWLFRTRGGKEMLGEPGGSTGVDNDYFRAGETDIGATIMGRNMFGPVRGSWNGSQWRGWWGDNPPFHHPVFVLTHHPQPPIEMEGGTVFHFVDGGIEAALEQAFSAAGGLDVRLGGGASTVRQYLRAGLVDELHLAVVPVLLGGGERLFDQLGGAIEGYGIVRFTGSDSVLHAQLARKPQQ
ncbi:bifunctional deaminase-reductase, C-terminal [Arthrobacter crystallopoietes BAB-32]|uniref:Bifunctional deaminase-reductase, C-terminal n=1 Tax=Arthrobacter crystallopoietes BAB-32 TaxID=1246476 RepID=N1UZW9_9MICC|nr:dihydrofolate reductase family protein [Arthrobacter crystallopoietes]EMY35951.1 bifunctional deaminase-reductase, C-terminal [Arthrobacter crystallopoietes BAB-32]